MNLVGLKSFFMSIGKHLIKNKQTYVKVVGGMVFASSITAAVCHYAYKKLEKKHRREDAEQYKKDFGRRLKDLEDQYKNNEYLLKKRINDLCDEFGIEPYF